MLAKLSTLALLLPLVSALTLNTPSNPATGSSVTFTWTASTSDPATFSLELVNDAFHDTFAIANNVETALGTLTIEIPQVPVTDGYTLEAVAVNNIGTVYSTTGTFSVGAATTSSASSASASASTASVSIASASTASGSVISSSGTATIPVSSASSGVSAASTSTAASTPSNLTSGAASFKAIGVAPAAALALSAVAGAVMVF